MKYLSMLKRIGLPRNTQEEMQMKGIADAIKRKKIENSWDSEIVGILEYFKTFKRKEKRLKMGRKVTGTYTSVVWVKNQKPNRF